MQKRPPPKKKGVYTVSEDANGWCTEEKHGPRRNLRRRRGTEYHLFRTSSTVVVEIAYNAFQLWSSFFEVVNPEPEYGYGHVLVTAVGSRF